MAQQSRFRSVAQDYLEWRGAKDQLLKGHETSASIAMYPEDIDPQSQCRLPLPRRDELDAEGQRIYDSLADPQGASLRGLRGPGGLHLHSPALARHTRPLNRYLRHEAGLGRRLRELAILVTARELDSQFEWAAHEARPRRCVRASGPTSSRRSGIAATPAVSTRPTRWSSSSAGRSSRPARSARRPLPARWRSSAAGSSSIWSR